MDQYSIVQRVWLLRGVAKLYSGTLIKRPATIGTRDLAVTEVITQQPLRLRLGSLEVMEQSHAGKKSNICRTQFLFHHYTKIIVVRVSVHPSVRTDGSSPKPSRPPPKKLSLQS